MDDHAKAAIPVLELQDNPTAAAAADYDSAGPEACLISQAEFWEAASSAVLSIIRDNGAAEEAESLFRRYPLLLRLATAAPPCDRWADATRLGMPWLNYAAACGHAAMVKCLLAHGADVDERDWGHVGSDFRRSVLHRGNWSYEGFEGWSALMHAAKNGDVATVLHLLAHGAATHTRSHLGGRTAADLASGALMPYLLALADEGRHRRVSAEMMTRGAALPREESRHDTFTGSLEALPGQPAELVVVAGASTEETALVLPSQHRQQPRPAVLDAIPSSSSSSSSSSTEETAGVAPIPPSHQRPRPAVLDAMPLALQVDALRLMLQQLPERLRAHVLAAQLSLRTAQGGNEGLRNTEGGSGEGRHLDVMCQEQIMLRLLCGVLFG